MENVYLVYPSVFVVFDDRFSVGIRLDSFNQGKFGVSVKVMVIYIYNVIHRHRVSMFHASSVWLDTTTNSDQSEPQLTLCLFDPLTSRPLPAAV